MSSSKLCKHTSSNLRWIIETHAHADHISGAHYLRDKVGGKIAIGAYIDQVQGVFKNYSILNLNLRSMVRSLIISSMKMRFNIGELKGKALYVPGHLRPIWLITSAMRFLSATPCLCRRRHRALRLSGWRCPYVVPLYPSPARLPATNSFVHVPRLSAEWS